MGGMVTLLMPADPVLAFESADDLRLVVCSVKNGELSDEGLAAATS
jgi:hypothetical protein